MTTSELPVAIDREKLAALCRGRGVRKLSLFGSVLRDDFDPIKSDIDVLVEYLPGKHPGMRHFSFQDELAGMLGRNVDLCTPPMLSSYFRKDALSNAVALYEHA
ncbi:MAG TPA: nucleotidyltransferase family protein [Opitutaceae bacterium]|nr:nucleotidyltransferase family protein [Opitutaceae bacterium]